MLVYQSIKHTVYRLLSETIKETQQTCLWCLKSFEPIQYLEDIVLPHSDLCPECQQKLVRINSKRKIDNFSIFSLYEYNEAFSRLLIQFKELGDIALKDVFIQPIMWDLKWKWRKKQLVLMPSLKEKVQERGFNHLELMFECLNLDMINCFNRIGNHKQVGLSAHQRKSIKFEFNDQFYRLKKNLVLVDDVFTTGSTITEAIRLLRPYNFDISVFTCSMSPCKKRCNKLI